MIEPGLFIALAVLAYALVSARLSSTVVTAPIFFAVAGVVGGPLLGLVQLSPGDPLLVAMLEAALVMVLFADASSIDLTRWTREQSLSARLLGVGLPLAIVAGALAAWVVVPGIEPWQAALLASILAPTDAALGQAVVANPRVPAVVRNALNVESGLNDGLALPFVTIFIAVGLAAGGAESEIHALQTLVVTLGGSTLIGLAVGFAGGMLLRQATARGLTSPRGQSIALVAIAAATYLLADEVGASGFLATWVAGLVTGTLARTSLGSEAFHLPEVLAEALAAIGFLLLGAALVVPVLERATPLAALYAVLSLTVVRIVPVAISMAGSGFARATVLYIGWFGPRGLASIVFAGVVVAEAVPAAEAVVEVALLTVVLSIVVHGVTAAWGARRYAAWFGAASARDPGIPEAATVAEGGIYARTSPRGGVHPA